jgi:2-polyprenyl-3-methyl-5-hydroxy-6-metoxy-1,4-benzoquinol methylase
MDRARVRELMDQFESHTAGAITIGVLAVADRAGILQELRAAGTVRPADLADRFDERMVAEILAALAAGGILEYSEGAFSFSEEMAAVLADESSPYLLAGWLDAIPAAMESIDDVAKATVEGGGVPLTSYDDRVVKGIDRLNSPGTKLLLTKRWLPAMPDVVARLEAGARVADLGCGSGTAALTMAAAYPKSDVYGYDIDERAIDVAAARARRSGLPNISFERRPLEELPSGFDLVTTFDVVHDLSHPQAALAHIRRSVMADGVYLMMEPAAAPSLEGNLHQRGATIIGFSVLFCLPQSLVGGGLGLGAAWGPVRARELCAQVGFTRFEQLPIENPYSNFYRIEP